MNDTISDSAADASGVCPKCGMQEAATACRQYPNVPGVVDVGWKCTKCGHAWGFEIEESHVLSVFVECGEDKSLEGLRIHTHSPPSIILETCKYILDALKDLPPDEVKNTIIIRAPPVEKSGGVDP